MEDTRTPLELVHVLRHLFRPSAELSTFFESTIPGLQRPRSFITLKSLSSLALDAVDVARSVYSLDMIDARKKVAEYQNSSFDLDDQIEARQIGEKALLLMMGVHDKRELYELLRNTKRSLPHAVELREPVDARFAVFALVHSQQAPPVDTPAHIKSEFEHLYKEKGGQRLLTLHPVGLSGIDEYRNIPHGHAYEEAS